MWAGMRSEEEALYLYPWLWLDYITRDHCMGVGWEVIPHEGIDIPFWPPLSVGESVCTPFTHCSVLLQHI